jgi:hypothetical protein
MVLDRRRDAFGSSRVDPRMREVDRDYAALRDAIDSRVTARTGV